MSTNELVATALPFASAVALVGVGLIGSRLPAPLRSFIERFALLPLCGVGLAWFAFEFVVTLRWVYVLGIAYCGVAIYRNVRRPTPPVEQPTGV